jgi:hypothetical protein
MFPFHAILGAESRLMDFCRRRNSAYSAQVNLVNLKRICGTERRTHIMGAPDIIQHEHKTRLREFLVLLH